jgi:hypothetical protein
MKEEEKQWRMPDNQTTYEVSKQLDLLGLHGRVPAILVCTQHGQGVQVGAAIDVGF